MRGQGYYTGMVFEITCPQFSGAVAGGGRYDNMVGKFLGHQVPAVGFSIGFERVCGILLEQGYQIPGAKPHLALLYLKALWTLPPCWPRQAVRHAGSRRLQRRCLCRQR